VVACVGLEAAALVDGDVDDDRAGLHHLDRLVRDELRSRGARDQDRADDEVGPLARFLDVHLVRREGRDAAA
jgi:hypothetical protein